MPLAVLAIGGHALSQAHEQGTIEQQFANSRVICSIIAQLMQEGWQIVLTHGNGPQVGNCLLRVESAAPQVYRLPLDIIDADTQGGMGYMLQQVLGNRLRQLGIDSGVVALVTQVVVLADDPAFRAPSKPIGPFMNEEEMRQRVAQLGWQVVLEANRGYRRVVPSPQPQRIVEIEAVRAMIAAGITPIAAGGGGVPVIEARDAAPGAPSHSLPHYVGVPAVIDKDRASALLAHQLGAEVLVICTGVANVTTGFASASPTALAEVGMEELGAHLRAGEFPPGSMGPKVEAVIDFLGWGAQVEPDVGIDRRAIITDAEHLVQALRGEAGTIVRRLDTPPGARA